jgi:hypothetical protein
MEAMTALVLTETNLTIVKRSLREYFGDSLKSSHLSEALAASMGYRTHAALLEHIHASDPQDPEIVLLQDAPFFARLINFGVKITKNDYKEGILESLGLPEKGVLINTVCRKSHEYPYSSKRHKAWRNIMVATVNAGIKQKIFSLREDDNRWPNANDERNNECVYKFEFLGMPALASVRDIRWGELSIHAALKPTAQGERWISAANAGFLAGEAFASGWLERKNGAWLQSAVHSLRIRKNLLDIAAEADIQPKGFGDRGRVIM